MKTKVFHLLTKHQKLDEALRAEQSRRWPDVARIMQIKKLKLAIKDRLHAASARRRKMTSA
jgi:uncharacterized protein